MSNKPLGKIDVTTPAGKTYTLQFTINALCTLEAELGGGAEVDLQKLIGNGASLSMLRTLFWAGLQQHHPGTTKEQAGDVMDAVGLVQASQLATAAIVEAFGAPAGGAAGAPAGGAAPLAVAPPLARAAAG